MNELVSVVVPTFDQRYLARTLAGLEDQTSKNFELIVVENGRQFSKTKQALANWTGACELRHIFEPRLGTNFARNTGVESARGSIVALLDDDCRPAGDWIDSIARAYDRINAAEIVGGRVELEFETGNPTWCLNPIPQFLSEIDWGGRLQPLGGDEWLAGANLSFRKSTHERLGGFRESFGQAGKSDIQLGNDEMEFCLRARSHPTQNIWYSPDIRVKHIIPPTRCTIESMESRRTGQGISQIASLKAHSAMQLDRDDLFQAVWHILKCHFWPYSGTVSETTSSVFLYYLVRCHVAYTGGMIRGILEQESKLDRHRMQTVMHEYATQGISRGMKVFLGLQDVRQTYFLADNFLRARKRSKLTEENVLVFSGYLTGLLNSLTALTQISGSK